MKKAVDIRHHAGNGVGAVLSHLFDLVRSGTPMWYSHSMQISLPVQSRIGFLTKSPGLSENSPYTQTQKLILGLIAELRLTVERPA